MIKRLGIRISLVELGDAMRGLSGVSAAACVAFDDDGQTGIVAFVVADGPVSALELRRAAGDRLPESMLPDRIELVDGLPLTQSSKLDERRLLAEAGLRGLPRRPSPAQSRAGDPGAGPVLGVGHDPPGPRPELPVLDHRVAQAAVEPLADHRRLQQRAVDAPLELLAQHGAEEPAPVAVPLAVAAGWPSTTRRRARPPRCR